MHPSTTTTDSDLPVLAAPPVVLNHSSNCFPSTFNPNSYAPLNDANRFPFPHLGSSSSAAAATTTASSNYLDLLRTWNYHRFFSSNMKTDGTMTTMTTMTTENSSSVDYPSHNSSFHRYSPRVGPTETQPVNEDHLLLNKFHHDTMVNLETGESKHIQHLTTNDFLLSAKQNRRYASLLARVEHIGAVDQSTGKAELRFFINDIEKMTFYYVLQEMPFFVQQYSCWSSISPESTYRRCGLKCRQLVCGDIIVAITEQRTKTSKLNEKPDYRQQSPTKCLVDRYMTRELVSPNKRHKVSNE